MAEQWVKLLCHWKGCEVFQNVGCTGSPDLVLVHPERGTLQIDVKTATWSTHSKLGHSWWNATNAATVKAPVHAAIVIPDGDISNWRVRWRKNHAPEGWENFWDNDDRIYSTKSKKA